MRMNFVISLALAGMLVAAGCTRKADIGHLAPGAEVTVTQQDGATVIGRVVEVKPDAVVVDLQEGGRRAIPRAAISSVAVKEIPLTPQPNQAAKEAAKEIAAGEAPAVPSPTSTVAVADKPADEWREVTVPAGTALPVRLETAVGSDISKIEDPVRARLNRAITIGGQTAIPAGSTLVGSITNTERPGKVQGRAQIALRFDTLIAGEERYDVRTAPIARTGRGTKKKDAMKIGIPAAGGAVIGGIIGGKKGAVVGGAAGGGAGTAVVLSTRGEEVRLPRGSVLTVRVTEPLTVRVRK